jgi:hypothetical protein
VALKFARPYFWIKRSKSSAGMRRVETDGLGFSVGIFWDWNLKKSGFILYTPEEYGLLIEKRGFF